MQKVYHSNEDVSFWSALYAQHHVYTRQENQGGSQQQQQQQGSTEEKLTAATISTFAPPAEQRQLQQCGETPGSIKVWQVLTKTILENDTSKPFQESSLPQQQQQSLSRPNMHFERLPIKVKTSTSALSPNGQPFSIVFFFTVDVSPMTLWYLESAFTQSSTVHEHMELMGTFQPNNPRDPTSFYIYETHTFNIVQPTQEDTMLDFHVQNPAGNIFAEFSYTFIKDPKINESTSIVSSSLPSLQHSPRIDTESRTHARYTNDTAPTAMATTTTITTASSPLLLPAKFTADVTKTVSPTPVETSNSLTQSPLDSFDLIEQESSPSSPAGYFSVFQDEPTPLSSSSSPSSSTRRTESGTPSTQTSLHDSVTITRIEQDEEAHEDDEHDESEEAFVESLSEEPDAGEHFMQATSEFFSKMGYWLYNSKMVQYIARDDRTRIKTVFQTDDIWILGVCYAFDQSEPPLSLHEAPRSRKSSMLQAHAISSSRSGLGSGTGGIASGVDNDLKSCSANIHNPGSNGSNNGTHESAQPTSVHDRPRSYTISSPRARTDSDAFSRISNFSRKQDNNIDVPRSRSKERKLEKQREKEMAKARKAARAKERELEKEQERYLERERIKEKARLKEQEKLQKFKAKISHPHFDRNNNLDGPRHITSVLALDLKENDYPNIRRELERKAQSVHGYQNEHRTNVGLGLSSDAFEPKHEGDALRQYPQELAPLNLSPEHSPPPPEDRPRSTKQRLLNLPTTLLTNLPRQRSPSSSNVTFNTSWRTTSPRSPTSRNTLPLVATMTSPSMPSLPHLPSCPSSPQSGEMEYPPGILDTDDSSDNRLDSKDHSKRDQSSSSRFSTSSHLSVDKSTGLSSPSPNRATLMRFMADFQSRIWFTYRKDISRIEPSFYTSDAGWGCMMRTGQSLLAQAFVQVMLGRDWRAGPSASEESCKTYRTLLGWFVDEPDRYYSIHSIAKMGVALDKRVGEWFGPSTVAHALSTIQTSEIIIAATGKESRGPQSSIQRSLWTENSDSQRQLQQQPEQWKPVVVMMPVRYGLEKLKEGYVANLKQLFKFPQFLGIAGGRPGRSLYFVACQGNDLFYFDPHIVKARATPDELSHCPASSYHCNIVRTMDIMELDPSMMLGFLIRSMQDLVELAAQMKLGMEPQYPLFTINGNIPTAIPSSTPASASIAAPAPAPAPAIVFAPTPANAITTTSITTTRVSTPASILPPILTPNAAPITAPTPARVIPPTSILASNAPMATPDPILSIVPTATSPAATTTSTATPPAVARVITSTSLVPFASTIAPVPLHATTPNPITMPIMDPIVVPAPTRIITPAPSLAPAPASIPVPAPARSVTSMPKILSSDSTNASDLVYIMAPVPTVAPTADPIAIPAPMHALPPAPILVPIAGPTTMSASLRAINPTSIVASTDAPIAMTAPAHAIALTPILASTANLTAMTTPICAIPPAPILAPTIISAGVSAHSSTSAPVITPSAISTLVLDPVSISNFAPVPISDFAPVLAPVADEVAITLSNEADINISTETILPVAGNTVTSDSAITPPSPSTHSLILPPTSAPTPTFADTLVSGPASMLFPENPLDADSALEPTSAPTPSLGPISTTTMPATTLQDYEPYSWNLFEEPATIDVHEPQHGKLDMEKENEIEELEESVEECFLVNIASEPFEQIQMSQNAFLRTNNSPVIVENKTEKQEKASLVMLDNFGSSTTAATTTTSSKKLIGLNLDAPLPPLPHERNEKQEPEMPIAHTPYPRPVSTNSKESRSRKEMKRITKAFQKEKWIVKPKSNKNKKIESNLLEPKEPVVQKFTYRYATTITMGEDEDAVVLHNEETLSIKSFDSDLSF
ncbi:Cysteine protease atg4b [Linnemannia zychae]|nr:Cysteine protease atg4b [Linnemannia zychae]